MKQAYIAVDLGGGSGRVIAGTVGQGRLTMQCVHRFPNRQVQMGGHIHWDILYLFDEIKRGLAAAVRNGYEPVSVGIDTWGVDFGIIAPDGSLCGNPICYRDPYTDGLPEQTFDAAEMAEHYAVNGIQVMTINSLYQLLALKRAGHHGLTAGAHLLFTPDLLSHYLCGSVDNEYTIASTSEMLDANTRQWDRDLIRRLGLPEHLFGTIVMPGTRRGTVYPEIAAECGLKPGTAVIAVASHDTQSAVRALPPVGTDEVRAFLSSGTWSLLGIELDSPVLTEEARKGGFSNEGSLDGRICLLQNITGLWMLQQLVAQWREAGTVISFPELVDLAESSDYDSVVDVDDPTFAAHGSMEEAINGYCDRHDLPRPKTPGDYGRCVMHSLAVRYKHGIDKLNSLLPKPVTRLDIIGGGSQNRLINKFTEELLGIPVHAGLAEATAIGNILVQAQAHGTIAPGSTPEVTELPPP